MSKVIEKARTTYNCVRYNTPLVLFQDESIKNYNSECEECMGILREIFERLMQPSIKEENDFLIVERDRANKDYFMNAAYALAIYYMLAKWAKENFQESSFCGRVPFEELEKFKSLYERLGLHVNSRFLERDLKEIKSISHYINEEVRLLGDVFRDAEMRQFFSTKVPATRDARERNFIAHSGLENNFTYVMSKKGKIRLSYEENRAQVRNIVSNQR